ncbi:hypothetical protein ACWEPR_19805 [Streptomyces sp. NPDC004290]
MTGAAPVAFATAWGTGTGELLPPVPLDEETGERIAAALAAATPGLLG